MTATWFVTSVPSPGSRPPMDATPAPSGSGSIRCPIPRREPSLFVGSLPSALGMQFRRPAGCRVRRGPGVIGRRCPSEDHLHASPGMNIVRQQREVPAELDNARQLAAVIDGAADRFGGGFIDREHALILST